MIEFLGGVVFGVAAIGLWALASGGITIESGDKTWKFGRRE